MAVMEARMIAPVATSVQDAAPLVAQRGVNVDGSRRSGGLFGAALAGNPYGESWNANASLGGGVLLHTGTYAPLEVDLTLPAQVPWMVGRTYNARQDDGSHHDSDGPQGYNWFQISMPEIVLYEGATDDLDVLYIVYGADRFIEFKRHDASSDEFKAKRRASFNMCRALRTRTCTTTRRGDW
jgi:hypothetical protein